MKPPKIASDLKAKVEAEFKAEQQATKNERFAATHAETVREREAFDLAKKNPGVPLAAIQQELAARELRRRYLLNFIQTFHPNYQAGWVHKLLCAKLEKFKDDILAQRSPRLMVSQPPRSGKSEILSKMFPAWLLGQDPTIEIISCSYAVSLPLDFSRAIKGIMGRAEYRATFPNTHIDRQVQAAERWMTTRGGGYVAAGVSGPITGRGTHCVRPDCTVRTRSRGIIPISETHTGEQIRGYDHSSDRPVWVRIDAVSVSRPSKPLYDITGHGPVVTSDHRVFTAEHGYAQAEQLQDVSVMRWNEVTRRTFLQRVQPEVVQPIRRLDVSAVRDGVSEETKGARALSAQARGRYARVLFSGMSSRRLRAAAQGQGSTAPVEEMPFLRRRKSNPRTCLQSVSLEVDRQRDTTDLRSLRGDVYQERGRDKEIEGSARRGKPFVLLSWLLSQLSRAASRGIQQGKRALSPLWKDTGWEKEEALLFNGLLCSVPGGTTDNAKLFRPVPISAPSDSGERRQDLSSVQQVVELVGCSSHRQQRGEQRHGESGDSVQTVSPLVSHSHGVSPRDLEKDLGGEGDYLVDLQTSSQNFFCDDVLVHNCLIIDDPVRDAEAADSDTIREATWGWFGSTAYTRLSPGGGCCVISTRWHHDDLSGRILREQKEAARELTEQLTEIDSAMEIDEDERNRVLAEIDALENWDTIVFPAIAESDEYLDPKGNITYTDGPRHRPLRRKGEALHPERYPLRDLLKKKRTLQPRHWTALYQQNPTPDEGDFFKRDMFRYEGKPDYRLMTLFVAWDLAIGEKERNDWTVGTVGALDWLGDLHVLDQVRFRSSELAKPILDVAQKYRPSLVGIEKGQLEKAILPELRRQMTERNYFPPLAEGKESLTPINDKVARARPLQGLMQNGKVHFPNPAMAPWVEGCVSELLQFPNGLHDDRVDSLAWLTIMALRAAPPKPPESYVKEKKMKSWKERLTAFTEKTKDPMAA